MAEALSAEIFLEHQGHDASARVQVFASSTDTKASDEEPDLDLKHIFLTYAHIPSDWNKILGICHPDETKIEYFPTVNWRLEDHDYVPKDLDWAISAIAIIFPKHAERIEDDHAVTGITTDTDEAPRDALDQPLPQTE